MVALQIHRDLVRPKVVVLAQIHDLADDLGRRLVRAVLRARRSVPQPLLTELFVLAKPLVESWSTDPEIAARLGHVAGHLSGVTQSRQALLDLSLLLSFVHPISFSQETQCVNNLRQF